MAFGPADGTIGDTVDCVRTMIEDIRTAFARTGATTGLTVPSPAVEAAMSKVDRSRFVPSDIAKSAWDDRALGIGFGATISQPFIVALMTSLAAVTPGDRVLEVGCGSGYQAAVLAELGAQVFSLEIVPQLRNRSARRLMELGYSDIRVVHGDGWGGLAEEAPFDAIVVTACAPSVPVELTKQLAVGGRLVLPVGEDGPEQHSSWFARTTRATSADGWSWR